MPFWELILDYYRELYFTHLDIAEPVNLVYLMLAVYLGVLIALVASFFYKQTTARIVWGLLGREALAPESAITAEEGGFSGARYLRALRPRSMLRKTVVVLPPEGEEESAAAPREIPGLLRRSRFYLPIEKREPSERRFARRGNGVPALILGIAAATAALVLIYLFLPYFLRMTDNALTSILGGSV